VGGEVGDQIAGIAEEPGRRGEGPGVDVVDRDPLGGVRECAVSGGVLTAARRIQFRTEPGQPELVHDRSLDIAVVRRPGRRLDHETEQAVADVRVLEAVVLRQYGGRLVPQYLQQLVPVREGLRELPPVRVQTVSGDPAGVREQVAHGPLAQRRTDDLGDVLLRLVVQPEPALLDQLEHGRRGERLRMRRDPEQVLIGQRYGVLDVGQPVRRGEGDPVRGVHGGLDPGHTLVALVERQPAVVVGENVAQVVQVRSVRHDA
jgi:hypothetical protein